MVEHHGQSSQLTRKTSRIETSVRVPSDAAKAVKELVADHPAMRATPLGKRVLFGRKKTPTAREAQPAVVRRRRQPEAWPRATTIAAASIQADKAGPTAVLESNRRS